MDEWGEGLDHLGSEKKKKKRNVLVLNFLVLSADRLLMDLSGCFAEHSALIIVALFARAVSD